MNTLLFLAVCLGAITFLVMRFYKHNRRVREAVEIDAVDAVCCQHILKRRPRLIRLPAGRKHVNVRLVPQGARR